MYTLLSMKISSKRINDSLKDIIISKDATIKFILDNETIGNHFLNQSIYGIVNSINDKEGNRLLHI